MSQRIALDPQMLVSAVRYAIGRRTYIVGWTVRETIRVWDSLPVEVKGTILRDLSEAIATDSLGDACDRAEWEKLLHFGGAKADAAERDSHCRNCDDRRCMGCVFREYEHDCKDDCPNCCDVAECEQ